MQKQVLIALAVVGTLTAGFFLFRHKPADVTTDAVKDVYNQWKVNYQISVGAAEDDYRFKVFSANYEKINTHNSLLGSSYTLGLNPFTHLTQEEFAATRLGLKLNKNAPRTTANLSVTDIKSVDWRDKLTPPRDQGNCGSCWAFSAIGALEGVLGVKGQEITLSEQELVDCAGGKYGNEGCNGGWMDAAFEYIRDNGIATLADYPYRGNDGRCKNTEAKRAAVKVSGFFDVPVNSPDALKAAIAQGPVAVAVAADSFAFQGYRSGVVTGKSCGTGLNHGVVAVGYGEEQGTQSKATEYYLVRNSWGTSWGDNGHVKIGIEEGAGVCGIQQAASYPTL